MSDTLKKLAIATPVCAAAAILIAWTQGLFSAETTKDTLRILSDGFFVAGGLLFCYGVLVWTSNGGVWDGLVFSAKTLFGRFRRDFEDNRLTFAEYREQREAKATSPRIPLLAGVINLAIAAVFLALYSV